MSTKPFVTCPSISAVLGTTMSPRSPFRVVALAAVGWALMVGVVGCAGAAASIDIGADTVVVDVRTPDEYAGGHLEGAVNIDFSSPSFDDAVADLDPDGDYVVYCQTGNRSARATAAMIDAGLSVQDAGGIDAASAASGLPIVP